MRFNAPEHLQAWQATRQFPAIHDDIMHLAYSHMRGLTALDLCCSTGLLAQRVAVQLGVQVIGVDADERALAQGRAAGLEVPLVHQRIDPHDLRPLENLLQQHQIETVLARRCLPELFGQDLAAGHTFAQMLHRQQVQEILVEGRQASKAAVNPLASLAQEVELLGPYYQVRKFHRNVAYLTRA